MILLVNSLILISGFSKNLDVEVTHMRSKEIALTQYRG